jgi:hypothetical protein
MSFLKAGNKDNEIALHYEMRIGIPRSHFFPEMKKRDSKEREEKWGKNNMVTGRGRGWRSH